jgi:hypothetical protein
MFNLVHIAVIGTLVRYRRRAVPDMAAPGPTLITTH